MENKNSVIIIGEGVLRGFFITLGLVLIYSIITLFINPSMAVGTALKVIITCLGIMYGSIYATSKIKRKGWINGLIVALLYMIILYLVALINGRSLALTLNDCGRTLIALLVGMLSGMLGINL